MPQLGFSKLPPSEEAICVRVREIRLASGLSQTAFASIFDLSRERLASYEYARAPIRWALGNALCCEFFISQRWLAEGLWPSDGYFAETKDYRLADDDLFSEGYKKVAPAVVRFLEEKSTLLNLRKDSAKAKGATVPLSKVEWTRSLRSILPQLIGIEVETVPDEHVEEFHSKVLSFSRALACKYRPPKPDGSATWDRIVGHMQRANLTSQIHSQLLLKLPIFGTSGLAQPASTPPAKPHTSKGSRAAKK